MTPIELRDYLTSRPELAPSYEALRLLLRPGETAMVTESGDGHPEYRVWIRGAYRTMGPPATTLATAIAALIAKLGRR